MNGFLAKLTVTPLLYACGVLLAVVLGMGVKIALLGSAVDTAQAKQQTAEEALDRVSTERDAWSNAAEGAANANKQADAAIESLRLTLEQQQQQCAATQSANDKAIAAARSAAADADAALKHFTAQFQSESRKPVCGAALAALDAACPALQGY